MPTFQPYVAKGKVSHVWLTNNKVGHEENVWCDIQCSSAVISKKGIHVVSGTFQYIQKTSVRYILHNIEYFNQ